jgi:hypothetical protein
MMTDDELEQAMVWKKASQLERLKDDELDRT